MNYIKITSSLEDYVINMEISSNLETFYEKLWFTKRSIRLNIIYKISPASVNEDSRTIFRHKKLSEFDQNGIEAYD